MSKDDPQTEQAYYGRTKAAFEAIDRSELAHLSEEEIIRTWLLMEKFFQRSLDIYFSDEFDHETK